MTTWLPHALAYIEIWLSHQMRVSEQPGCSVAVLHGADLVFERAYGMSDLAVERPMTSRHRFRVASHSKAFTAAGIMLLKEAGRLRLDDPVGTHVLDLHPSLAEATLGQLLSHSAGLLRDGKDCGHWNDARPWPDAEDLIREMSVPLILPPGERLKYSNLGYGLLGLVIASVVGEPFNDWVGREVVRKAGLAETAPDFPADNAAPLAVGYRGKLPLGRFPVDVRNSTRSLAPATGFLSTAADLARFFGQLDPDAPQSILSHASRRDMTRRHWRSPHSALEEYYGLGICCGPLEGLDTFGHTGDFFGYSGRTIVAPDLELTVSVLVNALDGPAGDWAAGVIHILKHQAHAGPPAATVAGWNGRWWNPWGVIDLVPSGERVLIASPDSLTPLADASEITVTAVDVGCITVASGFASFGEPVRRLAEHDGSPSNLWLAGEEYLPEEALVARFREAERARPGDAQDGSGRSLDGMSADRTLVILLNGVGSVGKTSTALALQALVDRPFLRVAMDDFIGMLPQRMMGHPDGLVFETCRRVGGPVIEVRSGPVMERAMRGMRHAVAALAEQGNDLIIDDVLFHPEEAEEYRRLLREFDLRLVGLFAPLAVLEQREIARGDREIGLARGQIDRVHRGITYDLEIDMSAFTAADAANLICRTFGLRVAAPGAADR